MSQKLIKIKKIRKSKSTIEHKLNWAYFPRSFRPQPIVLNVVNAFKNTHGEIDSFLHKHNSNTVLKLLTPELEKIGFKVEVGKSVKDKISVPVLYGNNGSVTKSFEADAYHEKEFFVIEVEAGRATVNNQFLKDLFQACLMDQVEYLGIAVRNTYTTTSGSTKDFDIVVKFLDTLYASNRFRLPLKGVLVLGY